MSGRCCCIVVVRREYPTHREREQLAKSNNPCNELQPYKPHKIKNTLETEGTGRQKGVGAQMRIVEAELALAAACRDGITMCGLGSRVQTYVRGGFGPFRDTSPESEKKKEHLRRIRKSLFRKCFSTNGSIILYMVLFLKLQFTI